MASDFEPGADVLHPSHGICRVLGVEHVKAAGESFDALAIAPAYAVRGVVKIPLAKVSAHKLRLATAEEANNPALSAQPMTYAERKAAHARAAKRRSEWGWLGR